MAKFKVLKDIPSLGAKAGEVAEVHIDLVEMLTSRGLIEAVVETKVPKGKVETK